MDLGNKFPHCSLNSQFVLSKQPIYQTQQRISQFRISAEQNNWRSKNEKKTWVEKQGHQDFNGNCVFGVFHTDRGVVGR
jgi:hypothetical protein